MSEQSLYHRSDYEPSRGGHAPGDLRDAFEELQEAYAASDDGGDVPGIEYRGREISGIELCGLLWNCSDIMPSLLCEALENCCDVPVRQGSTYAFGARRLKELLEAEPLG